MQPSHTGTDDILPAHIQLTEEQKWIPTLPDISSLQIHSGVLLYGR